MTSQRVPSLLGPVPETILADLARGIHAAAQPLAVLQAALSKEHTERMSAEELRRLTVSSAFEVQRLCTLFHCLQQLVLAAGQAQLSPMPILPLLADAVESVTLLFQNDGICLSLHMPDACPVVLMNRSRTLQALSQILLLAHSVSRPRDIVESIATLSESAVRINIRNQNPSPKQMSTEMSLSMAIAEANIRSQQAGFCYRLQPFDVEIDLPRALVLH